MLHCWRKLKVGLKKLGKKRGKTSVRWFEKGVWVIIRASLMLFLERARTRLTRTTCEVDVVEGVRKEVQKEERSHRVASCGSLDITVALPVSPYGTRLKLNPRAI